MDGRSVTEFQTRQVESYEILVEAAALQAWFWSHAYLEFAVTAVTPYHIGGCV